MAARSERRAGRQRRVGEQREGEPAGGGGETRGGGSGSARRRRRRGELGLGNPELSWAAGEEDPQELQLCRLGPSLETPAWLVRASRRWEGAGVGVRVSRLGAEAEPRCSLLLLLHRQKLSMELSPRSPPEMLESDCPSALELKSAPSKKMWIKLRSL